MGKQMFYPMILLLILTHNVVKKPLENQIEDGKGWKTLEADRPRASFQRRTIPFDVLLDDLISSLCS